LRYQQAAWLSCSGDTEKVLEVLEVLDRHVTHESGAAYYGMGDTTMKHITCDRCREPVHGRSLLVTLSRSIDPCGRTADLCPECEASFSAWLLEVRMQGREAKPRPDIASLAGATT
jgi:hypothetical protein